MERGAPPACKQHQPSHSQPGHHISRDDAIEHRLRSGARLFLSHGEAVTQTFPGIDFALFVTPHVRPRRRGGLGGFLPALVDALLNAVRNVLRQRVRDSQEEPSPWTTPVSRLRSACQRVSFGTVHPGGHPLGAGSSARDAKDLCFHKLPVLAAK